MREIVIGDIHGCFQELSSLMKTISPIKKDDHLIFIGDYIDRGPESFKVLSTLQKLKENYSSQITLLKGNHEDMMFDYFGFPAEVDYPSNCWFCEENGGEKTFLDLKAHLKEEKKLKKFVWWFYQNTLLKFETKRAVYVHGGLLAHRRTPPSKMLWMREELFETGRQPKLLVVGHTPTFFLFSKPAPIFHQQLNIIFVDNGTVFGRGPLAACDIISKSAYFSSGEIGEIKTL